VAFKSIKGGLSIRLALSVFAIVAALDAIFLMFRQTDMTSPDEFWASRRAVDLDVRALLELTEATGRCRVILQINAPAPRAVLLSFVNATRPELDRRVRLTPAAGGYVGHCGVVPTGHWYVEMTDDADSWFVRKEVSGAPDGSKLSARPDLS
jgi:hypothetical protein